MPKISEGIYWYTGAVTYQLGNVFLLIYIGILSLFINKKYILQSKITHTILLILIMFFTIGFNEIIMITVLLFSLILYIIFRLNNLNIKEIIFYLALVSICFSCIVYFAPGNSIRESFFQNNHKLFYSLILSFAQCIRFFFEWISSASLILMSILYYLVNIKLSEHVLIFRKSFYLTPIISISLLFLVIFIGAFPPYWSTGILGQYRTMNISYFLFIILWFINLTVFYNRGFVLFELKHKKIKVVFFILIWFSLVFTKNSYDLLEDIRKGNIIKFNNQMVNRYSIINSDKNIIYFEPIKNRPKTLFVSDITENPNDWQNMGYVIFFNKADKSIKLKKNYERDY